jgi:streptogramin lyase
MPLRPALARLLLALPMLLAPAAVGAQVRGADLIFAAGFEPGGTAVGPAGGVVEGPDGVRLSLPPGALATPATFEIVADPPDAPPLPGALRVIGRVYAITPHGQVFDATPSVRLPVPPTAQGPVLLLKASPGGAWTVVAQAEAEATELRAGVESLSYFAIGECAPGAILACPAGHDLWLELLDGDGITRPVSFDANGVPIPVRIVAAPEILVFRLRWTRPVLLFERIDRLTAGSNNAGGTVQRTSGFAFSGAAPNGEETSARFFERVFTVVVTPQLVAGASGPAGTVKRIWASADIFEPGPFGGKFAVQAYIPIRVQHFGPLPVIGMPPADLTVDEGASATFAANASVASNEPLAWRWLRQAPRVPGFTLLAGATAPTYTLAAASAAADDGAQYRVEACVRGTPRCTLSSVATLSVRPPPSPPVFVRAPANAAGAQGQPVSFTAEARGNPLPAIAWERAEAGDPNQFAPIVGEAGCAETPPAASGSVTRATCTLGPLGVADDGARIRAVARNDEGEATSASAALAVAGPPQAPQIVRAPRDAAALVGGNAEFSAFASGLPAPVFDWRLAGQPLPPTGGGFTTGACTLDVAYGDPRRSELRLRVVAAGCNGLPVEATARNGVPPDALATPARLTVVAPATGVALLAGSPAGAGSYDGSGPQARFWSPQAVATDAAGNAYVVDRANHTIRRVTPAGVVTTFAGAPRLRSGATPGDGIGAAARFSDPSAIAVDRARNVAYVGDANSLIRRIDLVSATVTTIAGVKDEAATVDGVGAAVRVAYPSGLAVAADGTIWFTEQNSHVVRRITVEGAPGAPTYRVETWAGAPGSRGSTDGPRTAARFFAPTGIAVDAGGRLVVADTQNHTLRAIAPDGSVSTLAGTAGDFGATDGTGPAARLYLPHGPAIDASGNAYFVDAITGLLRRATTAGVVSSVAGTAATGEPAADGVGAAARFEIPVAVAIDAAGRLLVVDRSSHLLRRVVLSGTPPVGSVDTLAGQVGNAGARDGRGAAARLRVPMQAGWDGAGTLYVPDTGNHTIRRVTLDGEVTTLAGRAGAFGTDDGVGDAARFYSPLAVAVGPDGLVYVVDGPNTIRRIDPATRAVTTFVGTAFEDGSVDGIGAAARLSAPQGLAFDAAGDLFVVESDGCLLRRITPQAEVTRFAGQPGVCVRIDGDGADAAFSQPRGIAIDAAGILWVTEFGGSAIRRVTPQGVVSTYAGMAGPGSLDGPLASARFDRPSGIAVGSDGSLLVADTLNHTLRRIANGEVSTVVGAPSGAMGIRLGVPGGLFAPWGALAIGPRRYVVTSADAVLFVTLP